MSVTVVYKAVVFTGGEMIPMFPEMEMRFPWHAGCTICKWFANLGGWRDAFDFAFSHAKSHNNNYGEPEALPNFASASMEAEWEFTPSERTRAR